LAHISLGALADGLLPLALCLVVSTWLACWQAGCAYGPETARTWWSIPARDEWGHYSYRWPVQPGGAVITVLSFWVLEGLRPKLERPGQLASLGLLLLSAQMAALSFMRVDPTFIWRDQRLDSWAALFFLILSLLGTLVAFFPTRQAQTPAPQDSLEPNPSPDG